MNLQDKMFQTTARLRTRARAVVTSALPQARARVSARVEVLKQYLDTLSAAGRELNKVARVHTIRFVKENSSIATKMSRDVSALARSTYGALAAGKPAMAPKVRKVRAKRKLVAAKAA